jgi:hypothetical protein
MKRVIGSFEKVSFPDFGLFDVVAKIDTGAVSGAVHATNIREITLETGEKAVKFRPFGKKPEVAVNSFVYKNVRSSNGISSMRYIIPTTVVIKGVQYPINVSLADRTLMTKGVLIGRKFLRQHGFIVDTSKGTKYRDEIKS